MNGQACLGKSKGPVRNTADRSKVPAGSRERMAGACPWRDSVKAAAVG